MTYKGYEYFRSLYGDRWVGIPIVDWNSERKLYARTLHELQQKIDAKVGNNLNPWELPRLNQQESQDAES